jgi:hypothetical protein
VAATVSPQGAAHKLLGSLLLDLTVVSFVAFLIARLKYNEKLNTINYLLIIF